MGSISVNKEEYNFIEELCKMEGKRATNMLRELIGLGRTMLAVKRYQEGKVSLGKAAKIAGITLSEFMDMLSEFGVESRVSYEDYLEGFENLRKIW